MSTIVDGIRPRQNNKRTPQQLLFEAPDQWRVRADLETFFGPGAETYLNAYDKMRAKASGKRAAVRTWSWPVFIGGFTWFFYRKLYVYGAMVIFLPVIFSYLFGSIGGGSFIIFAGGAKTWYVNHALGRIAKADDLGVTGHERTEYLERAGGVSLPAGIFAGIIYGLLIAFVIMAIAVRHKTGRA